MADLITKLQTIFAKLESVEGTAVSPAGSDAMLVSNLNVRNVPRDFHHRTFNGAMGNRSGKIGAIPPPAISFDAEVYGNGTTTAPQISPLLKTVFGSLNTDTIDTTATGGSTTTATLANTTGATVGNAIMVETGNGTNVYEMAWITAIVTNTSITFAPAVANATVNNAKLKFTTTYKVVDTGHPSLTIANYMNSDAGAGQWLQYPGVRGSAKFAAKKAGDIPMWSFALQAWNWVQATDGTIPSSISYGAGIPPIALATLTKLGGTLTNIRDLELDIGNQIGVKQSQNSSLGVYGLPVVDRKTVGKFSIHAAHNSVAAFTAWTANTTTTLSQQFGNTRFGTVGWYVPVAERTNVAYGDDGGIVTNEVTFNANITSGQDAIYFAVG